MSTMDDLENWTPGCSVIGCVGILLIVIVVVIVGLFILHYTDTHTEQPQQIKQVTP